MNTLISSCVAALVLAAAHTPGLAQDCASIEVKNVRPQQGQLVMAAYGSADTFSKKPLTSLRLQAGGETMTFQLCGLSGHEVALTMFQDLDSDGKMARTPIGMPTEPWGSSGTPDTFGPSWETAKVALDGRAIVVKLSQ